MESASSPGERLRIFRRALGLTGTAIARGLGRSKGTVSYWEAGKSPLPLSACLGLETAFGVSAQWLDEGIGPMWVKEKEIHPLPLPLGLARVSILPVDAAFDAAGIPVSPPPGAPEIGLPEGLLAVKDFDETTSHRLLWVTVSDPHMAETLGTQAFVLLDATEAVRNKIVDHALYLIRLEVQYPPRVRRIRLDPSSGDLIVADDTREHVPLRIAPALDTLLSVILGRVLWILRRPA